MSDLARGSGGISRSENEGVRAASGQAPAAQSSSSGLRTPRDIMNQRQAREARKRAEAEAAASSETQERSQEEELSRNAERRATTAGVAAQPRDSGYRSAGVVRGERSKPPFSVTSPQSATAATYAKGDVPASPEQQSDPRYVGLGSGRSSGSARRGPSTQDQSRTPKQPSIPESPIEQQSQQPRFAAPPNPPSQTSRGVPVPPIIIPPGSEGAQVRANVSSFPHAFERWETLSSQWEGLTSYWVRRLEQNADEIRHDIGMTQMSRHITDLSAAGANLFHAVVELQRLRSSSERKFQRWFFETRSQQEHDQDEIARLQDELDSVRQQRDQASRTNFERRISELTGSYLEVDRRNAELRRELQISKDEARRAWEELGRREHEERDRQLALREGHPIYIGGVQVQPMQDVLSRGPSTREGPFQRPHSPQQEESGHEYEGYMPQQPSPTDTDPFTATQPSTRPQRPYTVGAYQSWTPAAEYSSVPETAGGGAQINPTSPSTRNRPHESEYSSVPERDGGGSQISPTSPSTRNRPQQAQTVVSPVTPASPMVSRFYQPPSALAGQPEASTGPPGAPVAGSDDRREWEIDEYGTVRFDPYGHPIRRQRAEGDPTERAQQSSHAEHSDEEGEGDDVEDTPPRGYSRGSVAQNPPEGYAAQAAQTAQVESGGNGQGTQPSQESTTGQADYEGGGFGILPERLPPWEPQPQFQHSARLSDVVEEDDDGRSLASGRRARARSMTGGSAAASRTG